LRAVETYKKIITNYIWFCSSTMLISEIIMGIIENHSEFSGSGIAAVNLFQVDQDKP